jgi:DedD protein
MRNSWLTWVFVGLVVITVLFIFNYQGGKGTVPLSEIFPDEESEPHAIEYEFVDATEQATPQEPPASKTAPKEVQTQQSSAAAVATPLKETATTPAEVPEEIKEILFTIQVASFKDKTKADKALEDLKKKGYAAYNFTRDLGDKGVWYRIYVGKFDTKSQAEELLTEVKKEYSNSFIISPGK